MAGKVNPNTLTRKYRWVWVSWVSGPTFGFKINPELIRRSQLLQVTEITASRSMLPPLRFSVLLYQIFALYTQTFTLPGGWSLDGVHPCT